MQGAGLTFGQIRLGLADGMDYLESRSVPRTASARALTGAGSGAGSGAGAVRATLDALVAGGVVSFVAEGRDPVWLIGPEHQLEATFYRNSLIHFLLDTALCELAVLRAGEAASDPVEAFWDEIARLRDLLKFEFYFKERDEHRRQVAAEMARHDPSWEARLRSGPVAADELLAGMRPLVSHVVVRPFVEAYRLVADVLAHDSRPVITDSDVVREALGLGRQYVAQRRLRSSESVSALLFQTALQLARNRGLFEGDDLAARRAAFLAELRDLVRRLDRIEDLAIRRYIRDAVSAMPADRGRGGLRPRMPRFHWSCSWPDPASLTQPVSYAAHVGRPASSGLVVHLATARCAFMQLARDCDHVAPLIRAFRAPGSALRQPAPAGAGLCRILPGSCRVIAGWTQNLRNGAREARASLSTYGSCGDVEPMVGFAGRCGHSAWRRGYARRRTSRTCWPASACRWRPAGRCDEMVRQVFTGKTPPTAADLAAGVIAGRPTRSPRAADGCDVLVTAGLTTAASGAQAVSEKRGIRYMYVAYARATRRRRLPAAGDARPTDPAGRDRQLGAVGPERAGHERGVRRAASTPTGRRSACLR